MTILETNLPPAPATIEPPEITPAPLETETPPIVIRDEHPSEDSDSQKKNDGDDSAGDEGIDDAQADDTKVAGPPEKHDHEEDLGEE